MASKEKLTRRDFLKAVGLGAAASAAFTGWGAAVRSLAQQASLCGYQWATLSDEGPIATVCGSCPAGCGLLISGRGGLPGQVSGNPHHPLNRGWICPRAESARQSLACLDRFNGATRQARRGSGSMEPMQWAAAVGIIQDTLQRYRPGEIAFLMGMFPDHLFDLTQLLSGALGGAHTVRFGPVEAWDGRVTLMDATLKLFGAASLPCFDVEGADLIFSFGADFSESWFSPRAGAEGHGRRVSFAARHAETDARAGECILVRPGNEALLACALGRLIAERKGEGGQQLIPAVDVGAAVERLGIPFSELERLAHGFLSARRKIAVPGRLVLSSANGLSAAQSILALNILADNLGVEGGLFLLPPAPLYPQIRARHNTAAEIAALVERMRLGKIKAVFIHGVDALKALPPGFEFAEALAQVERVISFASMPDGASALADFIFPDRVPLESWGYQKVVAGVDRPAVSALQPVVSPQRDTMATADLLLAAAQACGGRLAAALPYGGEIDFLQQSLASYLAPDMEPFWAGWLMRGGWWSEAPARFPPVVISESISTPSLGASDAAGEQQNSFYLLPLHPTEAGGGALLTADGLAQAEIHPQAACRLGLRSGERVRIASTQGEALVVLCENAGIHPGAMAVPGECFFALQGADQNESGDMAFSVVSVRGYFRSIPKPYPVGSNP